MTGQGSPPRTGTAADILFKIIQRRVLCGFGCLQTVSRSLFESSITTESNDSSDCGNDKIWEWNKWNSGELEEVNRCIHEVIHDQVIAKPNAQAVCSEDGTLSYRELDNMASKLAGYLVGMGVGQEAFVPLCFDKSMWNVVAMLGVLKAGAAFVPLDPMAPIARLEALVKSVGGSIMLCSLQHAEKLASVANTIIVVNGENIRPLQPLSPNQLPRVESTNQAYLIFTSGTTGEPKGTIIEHGAYCSGAKAHGPAMLMNTESRVLQFAAHTFDASLVEILSTLMIGGVVCIPGEETRLNNITDFINNMHINWAVLTPSFIGFINPSEVPSLVTLVLAGEAMSQDQIMTWSKINLVNGYGPSECSVAAVVNSRVTIETGPANIGTRVGVFLWVVDPSDHNQLVPFGQTGELLIEGPTLARGYHRMPEKTSESFIQDPGWVSTISPSRKYWRMYKTGDLVHQNIDGTFNFVGRKDNQVKVHGQRVELGEIEYHLNMDSKIKHILAILPKTGHFRSRLTAVLSLSNAANDRGNVLQVVVNQMEESRSIRERLSTLLPAHMIPSTWLVVESIPLLTSGKLDRKGVMRWIQDMDEESYRRAVDSFEPDELFVEVTRPINDVEHEIISVWSHVLNLRPEQIRSKSFLSLGGDSISAMQVKSQCSRRGVSLDVQEVLRCKSTAQLARCAKTLEKLAQHEEILDKAFDLSPIQQLYFNLPNQGHGHFNQSFFLQVTRRIEKEDLRLAIETVIKRHSMLRARFCQTNDGQWQQRITDTVNSSYRLKAFKINSKDQAIPEITNSQVSLDALNGPVFAADLFEVQNSGQLLFMVGHHLVIDLVSWRVILEDIEELLQYPESAPLEKPLSFQSWCHLQAKHSQLLRPDQVLPANDVPAGDDEYWGMKNQLNTYGDVVSRGFEINSDITSLLLTGCHDALHTETIDILLSALIHSFARVFTDRNTPAVYTEGHGREPSDMGVDITRTVGWFTIMYPVHVPVSASVNLLETVRHVKDLRRRVPDNGRPYFASRCLSDEGRKHFNHHWPLELTFNFLGQYQQLEREGALLNPVDEMAGEARGAGGTADVGQDTPRFGLFEISAVIVRGKLRFSFTFNRHMKQQDKILQWIANCQDTLVTASRKLAEMEPEATLGDFPLLSLTYDRLDTIVKEILPQIGVRSICDVEDIYPCSSMQEGLLISQTKNSGFYAVHVICQLQLKSGIPDIQRLSNAWEKVVNRHALLRTVFIESLGSDDGIYDQVVLKNVVPDTVFIDCNSDEYALYVLRENNVAGYGDVGKPPHRFTICHTSEGGLFCKLEISHTLMDGGSMSIIFKDLALAYEGLLQDGPGPLYSDYIAYLLNRPNDAAMGFWMSYLSNVEPCIFPVLNDGHIGPKLLRSLRLDFGKSQFLELQKFCETMGVTFSNILHTAWGLTLHCYTDSEDTCFGYLKSERDAPITGIDDAVGPFINMLVCHINVRGSSTPREVLEQVQKDYIDSLPYQHTSLAEVQHALKLSGTALFNTALSYRRLPMDRRTEEPTVNFVECAPTYDPTEYTLSINIEASDDNAAVDLDYWTDCISDGQASNIANTFMQALGNIVHHSGQKIERLDHLGPRNHAQILKWNAVMPDTIDDCVHKIFEKQVRLQPSAPAICAWDATFTYAELDRLATQLANYLMSLGIGPEVFVPTCFDKSAWAVVAMMAVLKAGAAAVPLDATHPKTALEIRVRDTRAQVVLAAPSRAEIFNDLAPHVISVDAQFLASLSNLEHIASDTVTPENPCFIIFTSGSTGKPKGVVLEHRAISTSSHATGSAYGFGPHSRVLQFAAYTFDNSLAEIFITLLRGGTVCVPSEHDRFNNLAEAINKLEVNFMDITPTVASFLHPSDVPKVKGLSLGGEPLTKENIDVWGKAVDLHCCYGPSECSINSIWNGDLMQSSDATNIGKSIGSLSWVVNPSDHDYLTPLGCIGELLIEGPILSRGYLNDPDKTSEAFIKNPAWAPGEGRRMYKTGDLVRYNSDGSLTFLGRKDSQVKLNGQRLELGEIEHHLKSNLPSEAQSAVELITITNGDKVTKALAAFLCLQLDGSVPVAGQDDFLLPMSESSRHTATALETAISAAIPAYMVPTLYIPVISMPMTSSGKLDRRRLREICRSFSESQASIYRLARKSGRAPSTEMEKSLQKLWESILTLPSNSVGAEDNFFRLGGDSIEAMRLITAARVQGISLTVASIFRKPKLFEVSSEAVFMSYTDSGMDQAPIEPFTMIPRTNCIEKLVGEVASYCKVEPDSIQDIYPCTAIQEGLIALSTKNSGAYVAQNIYRLPPEVDIGRFRQAWETVVQAELILRTRIVYTEAFGFLQAVIQGKLEWFEVSDLQEITESDRQLPAHNGGTLSRYTIVEGNIRYFVWTSHHALYDGWCIPLMLKRVEGCYHDLKSIDFVLGASYPRFIQYLSKIDGAESDTFWKSKLDDTTAVQFPVLPHPSYQVQAKSLLTHTAWISRKMGTHITLPSMLRASWAMVVAIYSGNLEDVIFGETLTGRDAPIQDIADIIGPTLATVPTRIHIDRESSITEFLEVVQTQSAEAIPFQYAGLQHIKHLSDDTAKACEFQNLLAIHHDSKETGNDFWDLVSSTGKVDIDAYYDQDVIPKWLLEKMMLQFDFILTRFNSKYAIDEKIGDINVLNPHDQSIIRAWNSDSLNIIHKCIHNVIQEQISLQPVTKIAVDAWDIKFTYREMDKFSMKLAWHLMELAMLAIMKAGSAFVPVDPAAPLARLQNIVGDTNAKILLCSPKYYELCKAIAPRTLAVDNHLIDQLPLGRYQLPVCKSDSPAYVIFTSGTTGKPKGTIIEHSAFCSGAAAHGPALKISSTSRVLQFASYTFDASLLEILTTLTLGGSVCVPSDEDRLNNITSIINDMGVTWTLLTPSFIQLIQPSMIPGLQTLVLGGEAMGQNHIATWAEKLELINAYGPSECSVVATANSRVTLSTEPTNMGRAVGGRSWVVDPRNHDRLTPIGAVGELLIDGPILARGYLCNDIKTAEVFVENPRWVANEPNQKGNQKRRMYKTGDLVKYNPDGTILFCGRKDTQVKVHGQRLELSEVEYHLRSDTFIQHALTAIPSAGFCKGRLVAVLSIQELAMSGSPRRQFEVVSQEAGSFYLSGIKERLCDLLPAYMVPSNWVVLKVLPLLPSGKLDRRRISEWIENMDEDIYKQISDVDESNMAKNATIIERKLQAIWGNALNLPADQIGLHQSFLHLGGDSISAMQVMSKCRSEDLGVTVQDIIKSKSISQLALRVTLPEIASYEEEVVDKLFGLSPIQKLYFRCVGDNPTQFNQSVVVRLTRRMPSYNIREAIETVVKSHSMLRARFNKNQAGTWQQKVIPFTSEAYHYSHRTIAVSEVVSLVKESQEGLDIEKGPIFAADLFEIEGGDYQILSLVAHHLVIDVVSWRIILQDLEDVLKTGTRSLQSSLSFQMWSQKQAENTQSTVSKKIFYPGDVSVADLAYWGMADRPNVHRDTVNDSFKMDAETTLLLLGACHESLKTEPVDVFIAAIAASFQRVFSDRSTTPAIYNEGHGREPWANSKIDLSRTVGWFTTMCPIYLPDGVKENGNLVNTIRWVKDLRNRILEKGRSYFAYRILTEEGQERFAGHFPMEITFNYLGKLQQLERKDALFQTVDEITNATFDIGSEVPRFSLFEITASVVHGNIEMTFSYNRNMNYQAKIRRWVIECQRSLQEAATRLVQLKPERTLSDFPLLSLTFNGVAKLVEELPQLGVSSLDEVEDVYPCSSMQQGMLLAQTKHPELYAYATVFEVHSTHSNKCINIKLLAEAWQSVVQRHSTLRTVFIDSAGQDGLMDQVVLRHVTARITWVECDDDFVLDILGEQIPINFRDHQPPHRFTLCKTKTERIFCKLEISHAISDGTSIPILLRDLSKAYEDKISKDVTSVNDPDMAIGLKLAKSKNRSSMLPSETIVGPLYSDYIAYVRAYPPDFAVNYWKAYLTGIETCNFPTLSDGINKPKELRSLILEVTEPIQLRNFCSQNGVTLSNVLQLVWALILRAYTGSNEICFGYLTSGRDAPISGIQDEAVGTFINMLTCRMNLTENLPLSQALTQIQTDYMQSITYQSCSLADIQHELQLSGTSLFNTAYTFQKRSQSTGIAGSSLMFSVLEARDPSEYDVTVNVEATDSKVEVHFGYWTSILSGAQADNMAKTFDHVLNSIISRPKEDRTVGELDLLSEHSRRQVMNWNKSLPRTIDRCIHDLIYEQRLRRPTSALAIYAWDLKLTFTELEQITTHLATQLVELGIGPEDFVPLCFEKSVWAVVSMISVMKAGGAFVPLDPSHPEARLRHLIQDVNAKVVLCSRKHEEKISPLAAKAFVVDSNTISQSTTCLSERLPIAATPKSAAYAIFTSGTTGLPKGTIIEHAAFCTSAVEHSKAMGMCSDSRVFQFASFTFDASIMEILSALIVGACVCIPSDEDRMNDIPGAIKNMGVTWTLLTPSVASTLTPKLVPSLKVLVTGGEAMATGHIAKWKKGNVCLVNAYGPSEASVVTNVSIKVDEEGNEINTDPARIGHAVGGRSWVVDPRDYNKLMPVGCIGELVIEGRIVARGYLNNEQKTAEAFIKKPTWLEAVVQKERLYRTGDLVRYNSDGSLNFVARKDTQIKLNGQRLELGEIEYQVKGNLPENYEAAVDLVSPQSRIATKALAVFFCPQINLDTTTEPDIKPVDKILMPMSERVRIVAKNLDSSLARVLPAYMIPSFYIPVTKMPWTTSGKLDRGRLRNIVQMLSKEGTAPYRLASAINKRAVTTKSEEKLRKLWESVLRIEKPSSIGREDNFFRQGGDSVTAMRLVGAARSEQISLTVLDIFRNPKLSDMALVCSDFKETALSELKPFVLLNSKESRAELLDELEDQCHVSKDQITDAYPCSGLQEGLFTLSIKQSGAYVAQNVFRLPPDVDMVKFKNAWQRTVDEVDTLRTRIVHLKSSAFLQVVTKISPITWYTANSLQDTITEDVAHIPAHNGAPLTRFTIVDDDGSGGHYFLWSIHHALYDGWSLPMILRRVESTYLNDQSTFPKTCYASFIKYLSDVDSRASDDFWKTRLSGVAPIQFPQTQHLGSEKPRKNEMLTHRIRISQENAAMDVTISTIIKAAWAVVIAAYSGSNDVVFGETLAGRDVPVEGIMDVIGPVFTTIPTRVQVDRGVTVSTFLRQIHQMALEVIPYQHAGLQHIKRLDSDTAIACDFQNLLVIQTIEENAKDELWDLQSHGMESNFFTYPLVVECTGTLENVEINAHYDANIISTWQLQRLLFQFESVMKQLITSPKSGNSINLGDVEVFSPEDQELVKEWNYTEPEIVDRCIHDIITDMALSQPQATAVSAWDGELTYQELLEHSTHFAQYLQTLGVGPEVFVPFCLDRSAWVVVTILGILMAGGAYVPLDPASPTSRCQGMLQDVNANIVLCSPQYSHKFTGIVGKTVSIDKEMIMQLPRDLTTPQNLTKVTSRNAAYVLFTSGSTGRPKGVLVEHRAVSTSSKALIKGLLIKPTSRVFQFGSYTFDVTIMEILTSLTIGACIAIPSEDMRLRDVSTAMSSLRVTWTFLTPSVVNLIEPSSVPTLEVLVVGGEAMSADVINTWAGKVDLRNGYGPTESTVIAIVNANVNKEKDPTKIGRSLSGGHAWIVDPDDHNRITPRGLTFSQIRLGKISGASSPRRMYKTGDLVHYDADGSLIFHGRIDNQVKLNGQRMELGEIEHALYKNNQILHALVILPKSGPFKKRLVAVLSLNELASTAIASNVCRLLEEESEVKIANKQIQEARNQLSDLVAPYMIPSLWLVMESIPLLTSGKLDRRYVTGWLETVDEQTYENIVKSDEEDESSIPETPIGRLLRQIFSRVLNIPIQRVKLSQSFMSLGGDSITAMQVMALCRKEKLNFSLSEVLRAKSIHHLAENARLTDEAVYQVEKIDDLFSLSPIQQLYFESQPDMHEKFGKYFNQSFSLRITRHIDTQVLKHAIETIVNQHSMLRARVVKDSQGTWKQRIVQDASSSYRFNVHDLSHEHETAPVINKSQSSLDYQEGPLFSVDLFNVQKHDQIIFLVAHHLVVDMMSWRIILQDLEEILNSGFLTAPKPLSFQAWCSMQADQARKFSAHSRNSILPAKSPASEVGYWGMNGKENTYGDVNYETFMINEKITELALGDCNKPLRTEPIDLFLSSIAHSFSRVFLDRQSPTLFNEGHGRESWDSSIDISRTVGWFTTMFPVHVGVQMKEDNVIETTRRMKDNRHQVPDNGRPYFAHQFLTSNGRSDFNQHRPMEILFNYLGRMQQLEHDDSLLQQWSNTEDDETSRLIADVGPKTSRLALFEISAAVMQGKLQFSFIYNRKMKHQQMIHRWIKECQRTLEELVEMLASLREPIFTLTDFPLMPKSYGSLEKLVNILPDSGILPNMVEDIYPCAPLQEGILLSQLRDPAFYHFYATVEVKPAVDGTKVNGKQLLRAWQKVVNRHGALRSVFIESLWKGDVFNQIVIRRGESGAILMQCDDSSALNKLNSISIIDTNYAKQLKLPHQFTVCETTSGKVYFKVEINHAVMDGGSLSVLLQDLAEAYHGRLPDGPGPLYSEYIAYIKSKPQGAVADYWKSYLQALKICHFPAINTNPEKERHLKSVPMEFGRFPALQELCKSMNVTLSNILQTAWAFCLRSYTNSDDVCFGYLTSGRDVPIKDIENAMGAFINMLVCRVKFDKDSSLQNIFQRVQGDYLQSLEHQHCSLAQIQHDLKLPGKALFNTAVSIQGGNASGNSDHPTVSFETVEAHDPSEYAVTLNIRTLAHEEGVVIRYWSDILSDKQAVALAITLSKILNNIVDKPEQKVSELDIPRDQGEVSIDVNQLHGLSSQLRPIVNQYVREIIREMFQSGSLIPRDEQSIQDTKNFIDQQTAQAMVDYSQMSKPTPISKVEKRNPTPKEHTKSAGLNQVERKLLSVWNSLLQISENSIESNDSFFQLGGDSIIAMQMVGAAREVGLNLTVANIFRHPTFAEMASVIRFAEDISAAQSRRHSFIDDNEFNEIRDARTQTIENALYQRFSLLETANVNNFLQDNICAKARVFRGGIVDVFPVTDFQALAITGTLMESKWMLNYFYLDGNGALDLKRLKLSVIRVVEAFDILRTVFVPYGNRFFQVVLRRLLPNFLVEECDDLSEFTVELQKRDRQCGPRLGESCLQFTIARQKGTNKHRIIIRISHAQYDGVCFPSILTALQAAYEGNNIESPPAFSTYVRDAAKRTTNNHYDYWKTLLQGSSMTNIVQRRGPNYTQGAGQPTILKRIVHISSLASENVTPATVIKAAWTLVLAQISAKSDIVFGNVISGRNAAVLGIENIVGPCVNMIPVRIKFQPGWTALDLLHAVQSQQVADMPYESLGFREIIKHCTDWPDWTNFSSVCQHQNIQHESQMCLGNSVYKLGAVGSQEDFADLTVLSTPQGADEVEISLFFTASSNGITKTFAEKLFEMLCTTSENLSTNPEGPLPSPEDLAAMDSQVLGEVIRPMDPSLSSSLEYLDQNEILTYLDILRRSWYQILGENKAVESKSSFFDLGGDIIGLAQVTSILEQEGFKMRVEDLINHPILIEQVALLVAVNMKQNAPVGPDMIPETQQATPSKKGLKSLWGRSIKLAKKIKARKGRECSEMLEGPTS
ncbi:hypothetical protein B7494_g5755 [Chlorociboria aeruginascens]|nr:hypothetical protein B7494_g5755 [Chlorociboria aeruginascens]